MNLFPGFISPRFSGYDISVLATLGCKHPFHGAIFHHGADPHEVSASLTPPVSAVVWVESAAREPVCIHVTSILGYFIFDP